jgi:hypothetical protein
MLRVLHILSGATTAVKEPASETGPAFSFSETEFKIKN